MAESRDSNITNNAGGVMTDEVGVITGDLILRSELVTGPTAGRPPSRATPASVPTTAPAAAPTRPAGKASAPAPLDGGPPAGGIVRLRVQYQGAAEWYTVTNGSCQLNDVTALDAVHQLAVALLNRPEG